MKSNKPLCNEAELPSALGREDPNDWEAVNAFATKRPHYKSESALRHEIIEAEHNGLLEAGAILRVGGRVFLSPSRYFQHWKNRSNALAQQPDPQVSQQLELNLTTES